MGSRVLGLLRDCMLYAALGTGLIHSAFIVAFTLPNLFRRLLGEGALTSAVVPVLTSEFDRSGKEKGFIIFNQVLTRLMVVLIFLVGLGILLTQLFGMLPDIIPRWELGARYAGLLMPYMLLICLAALFAAALNILQRFAIPALTAVWLNVSMITALGIYGLWLGKTPDKQVFYLCGGVLFGGILQLLVPAWALWREGWRPRLDFTHTPFMSEIMRLFIPGVLAAGIMQINIVVSRLLALSLDDKAASILYLPSRIVELPLGLFTVAVTTVMFPRLTRLVLRDDKPGIAQAYTEGLRLIMAFSIPAAVGLYILAEPILDLFKMGKFGNADVALMLPVLLVFGLGIPFYSLATYATRGYHAMKDMRTPMIYAGLAFVSNLVLSLILMWNFGAPGLATAGVLSVVVQSILLHRGLQRANSAFAGIGIKKSMLKIGAATVVMGVVAYCGYAMLRYVMQGSPYESLATVAVVVPMSVVVYFLLLWFMRFEERDAIVALLRKKSR